MREWGRPPRSSNRAVLVFVLLVIASCGTPEPEAASDAADVPAPATTSGSAAVPQGLILKKTGAAPGYVLFGPLISDTAYLVDVDGRVVHTWKAPYAPGSAFYLLDNGHLLRGGRLLEPTFHGGGQGGLLQEYTWEGELVWEYELATEDRLLHHDIAPLHNGNIVAIAWERKSADEARAAGRRPNLVPAQGLWPDFLLELDPQGARGARVVWEWHAWDHLVQNREPKGVGYGDPAAHPERIDTNGDGEPEPVDAEQIAQLKALGYMAEEATPEDLSSDLMHTNAVAYHPRLDQIAISVPRFNEIWILDHSTTTEEARGSSGGRYGRGGDLLYRWGNPRTYGRGEEGDQRLFGQHDVRWVPDPLPGGGHLMVFNNDVKRPEGNYSEVLELALPIDESGHYNLNQGEAFGPRETVWSYTAPDKVSFHAEFISGAHRLANGNTFVTSGPQGRFFEVTAGGEIVWEYWSPYAGEVRLPDGSLPQPLPPGAQRAVFRATKLSPDHPALHGRNLRPLDPQPTVVPFVPPPQPAPTEEKAAGEEPAAEGSTEVGSAE